MSRLFYYKVPRGLQIIDVCCSESMRSGHTAGAALDVYPSEPAANGDYFNDSLNSWGNDLRSLKNLILTPHIGGSTEGKSLQLYWQPLQIFKSL